MGGTELNFPKVVPALGGELAEVRDRVMGACATRDPEALLGVLGEWQLWNAERGDVGQWADMLRGFEVWYETERDQSPVFAGELWREEDSERAVAGAGKEVAGAGKAAAGGEGKGGEAAAAAAAAAVAAAATAGGGGGLPTSMAALATSSETRTRVVLECLRVTALVVNNCANGAAFPSAVVLVGLLNSENTEVVGACLTVFFGLLKRSKNLRLGRFAESLEDKLLALGCGWGCGGKGLGLAEYAVEGELEGEDARRGASIRVGVLAAGDAEANGGQVGGGAGARAGEKRTSSGGAKVNSPVQEAAVAPADPQAEAAEARVAVIQAEVREQSARAMSQWAVHSSPGGESGTTAASSGRELSGAHSSSSSPSRVELSLSGAAERGEGGGEVLRAVCAELPVARDARFELYCQIRFALASRDALRRSRMAHVRLLALASLVMYKPEHYKLDHFFVEAPDFVAEVLDVLYPGRCVAENVCTGALYLLTVLTLDRERQQNVKITLTASGRRGILAALVHRLATFGHGEDSARADGDSPGSVSGSGGDGGGGREVGPYFVDALLNLLNALTVSTMSPGRLGNSVLSYLTDSGVVPALLNLVPRSRIEHSQLLSSGLRILESFMDYCQAATQLFKDLDGLGTLLLRLNAEVARAVEDLAGARGKIPNGRRVFIKELLRTLGCVNYAPDYGMRSRDPRNGLLTSILSIFQHAEGFGGTIFRIAAGVFADLVHQEATSSAQMEDLGLPEAFLSVVCNDRLPESVDAAMSVPHTFSAVCLSMSGQKRVLETGALNKAIVWMFTDEGLYQEAGLHNMCSDSSVRTLASGLDELLRHVPELRPAGIAAFIQVLRVLVHDAACVDTTAVFLEGDEGRAAGIGEAGTVQGKSAQRVSCMRLSAQIFCVVKALETILLNAESCREFIDGEGMAPLMELFSAVVLMPREGTDGISSRAAQSSASSIHPNASVNAFVSCLRGLVPNRARLVHQSVRTVLVSKLKALEEMLEETVSSKTYEGDSTGPTPVQIGFVNRDSFYGDKSGQSLASFRDVLIQVDAFVFLQGGLLRGANVMLTEWISEAAHALMLCGKVHRNIKWQRVLFHQATELAKHLKGSSTSLPASPVASPSKVAVRENDQVERDCNAVSSDVAMGEREKGVKEGEEGRVDVVENDDAEVQTAQVQRIHYLDVSENHAALLTDAGKRLEELSERFDCLMTSLSRATTVHSMRRRGDITGVPPSPAARSMAGHLAGVCLEALQFREFSSPDAEVYGATSIKEDEGSGSPGNLASRLCAKAYLAHAVEGVVNLVMASSEVDGGMLAVPSHAERVKKCNVLLLQALCRNGVMKLLSRIVAGTLVSPVLESRNLGPLAGNLVQELLFPRAVLAMGFLGLISDGDRMASLPASRALEGSLIPIIIHQTETADSATSGMFRMEPFFRALQIEVGEAVRPILSLSAEGVALVPTKYMPVIALALVAVKGLVRGTKGVPSQTLSKTVERPGATGLQRPRTARGQLVSEAQDGDEINDDEATLRNPAAVLERLKSLGYPEEASAQAIEALGNNATIAACVEWMSTNVTGCKVKHGRLDETSAPRECDFPSIPWAGLEDLVPLAIRLGCSESRLVFEAAELLSCLYHWAVGVDHMDAPSSSSAGRAPFRWADGSLAAKVWAGIDAEWVTGCATSASIVCAIFAEMLDDSGKFRGLFDTPTSSSPVGHSVGIGCLNLVSVLCSHNPGVCQLFHLCGLGDMLLEEVHVVCEEVSVDPIAAYKRLMLPEVFSKVTCALLTLETMVRPFPASTLKDVIAGRIRPVLSPVSDPDPRAVDLLISNGRRPDDGSEPCILGKAPMVAEGEGDERSEQRTLQAITAMEESVGKNRGLFSESARVSFTEDCVKLLRLGAVIDVNRDTTQAMQRVSWTSVMQATLGCLSYLVRGKEEAGTFIQCNGIPYLVQLGHFRVCFPGQSAQIAYIVRKCSETDDIVQACMEDSVRECFSRFAHVPSSLTASGDAPDDNGDSETKKVISLRTLLGQMKLVMNRDPRTFVMVLKRICGFVKDAKGWDRKLIKLTSAASLPAIGPPDVRPRAVGEVANNRGIERLRNVAVIDDLLNCIASHAAQREAYAWGRSVNQSRKGNDASSGDRQSPPKTRKGRDGSPSPVTLPERTSGPFVDGASPSLGSPLHPSTLPASHDMDGVSLNQMRDAAVRTGYCLQILSQLALMDSKSAHYIAVRILEDPYVWPSQWPDWGSPGISEAQRGERGAVVPAHLKSGLLSFLLNVLSSETGERFTCNDYSDTSADWLLVDQDRVFSFLVVIAIRSGSRDTALPSPTQTKMLKAMVNQLNFYADLGPGTTSSRVRHLMRHVELVTCLLGSTPMGLKSKHDKEQPDKAGGGVYSGVTTATAEGLARVMADVGMIEALCRCCDLGDSEAATRLANRALKPIEILLEVQAEVLLERSMKKPVTVKGGKDASGVLGSVVAKSPGGTKDKGKCSFDYERMEVELQAENMDVAMDHRTPIGGVRTERSSSDVSGVINDSDMDNTSSADDDGSDEEDDDANDDDDGEDEEVGEEGEEVAGASLARGLMEIAQRSGIMQEMSEEDASTDHEDDDEDHGSDEDEEMEDAIEREEEDDDEPSIGREAHTIDAGGDGGSGEENASVDEDEDEENGSGDEGYEIQFGHDGPDSAYFSDDENGLIHVGLSQLESADVGDGRRSGYMPSDSGHVAWPDRPFEENLDNLVTLRINPGSELRILGDGQGAGLDGEQIHARTFLRRGARRRQGRGAPTLDDLFVPERGERSMRNSNNPYGIPGNIGSGVGQGAGAGSGLGGGAGGLAGSAGGGSEASSAASILVFGQATTPWIPHGSEQYVVNEMPVALHNYYEAWGREYDQHGVVGGAGRSVGGHHPFLLRNRQRPAWSIGVEPDQDGDDSTGTGTGRRGEDANSGRPGSEAEDLSIGDEHDEPSSGRVQGGLLGMDTRRRIESLILDGMSRSVERGGIGRRNGNDSDLFSPGFFQGLLGALLDNEGASGSLSSQLARQLMNGPTSGQVSATGEAWDDYHANDGTAAGGGTSGQENFPARLGGLPGGMVSSGGTDSLHPEFLLYGAARGRPEPDESPPGPASASQSLQRSVNLETALVEALAQLTPNEPPTQSPVAEEPGISARPMDAPVDASVEGDAGGTVDMDSDERGPFGEDAVPVDDAPAVPQPMPDEEAQAALPSDVTAIDNGGGEGVASTIASDSPTEAPRSADGAAPIQEEPDPIRNDDGGTAGGSGPDMGIDPEFLAALPPELRAEVLATQVLPELRRRSFMDERPGTAVASAGASAAVPSSPSPEAPTEGGGTATAAEEASTIDPEFLAALPEEMREELLREDRRQRRREARAVEAQASGGGPAAPDDIDSATFIASLPPELRAEVLMTSEESVIATLPPALLAEAMRLRARGAPPRFLNGSGAPGSRNAPPERATANIGSGSWGAGRLGGGGAGGRGRAHAEASPELGVDANPFARNERRAGEAGGRGGGGYASGREFDMSARRSIESVLGVILSRSRDGGGPGRDGDRGGRLPPSTSRGARDSAEGALERSKLQARRRYFAEHAMPALLDDVNFARVAGLLRREQPMHIELLRRAMCTLSTSGAGRRAVVGHLLTEVLDLANKQDVVKAHGGQPGLASVRAFDMLAHLCQVHPVRMSELLLTPVATLVGSAGGEGEGVVAGSPSGLGMARRQDHVLAALFRLACSPAVRTSLAHLEGLLKVLHLACLAIVYKVRDRVREEYRVRWDREKQEEKDNAKAESGTDAKRDAKGSLDKEKIRMQMAELAAKQRREIARALECPDVLGSNGLWSLLYTPGPTHIPDRVRAKAMELIALMAHSPPNAFVMLAALSVQAQSNCDRTRESIGELQEALARGDERLEGFIASTSWCSSFILSSLEMVSKVLQEHAIHSCTRPQGEGPPREADLDAVLSAYTGHGDGRKLVASLWQLWDGLSALLEEVEARVGNPEGGGEMSMDADTPMSIASGNVKVSGLVLALQPALESFFVAHENMLLPDVAKLAKRAAGGDPHGVAVASLARAGLLYPEGAAAERREQMPGPEPAGPPPLATASTPSASASASTPFASGRYGGEGTPATAGGTGASPGDAANAMLSSSPLMQTMAIELGSARANARKSTEMSPMAANAASMGHSGSVFWAYCERHKRLVNAMVRQNPGLLSGAFNVLFRTGAAALLEFDNKRTWFKGRVKKVQQQAQASAAVHGGGSRGTTRVTVRRDYVLEDSYHQLRLRSVADMRGKLSIQFRGEDGVDAGGVQREWWQSLCRQVFNPGHALFTSEGNSTYQPNPFSGVNPDHLLYFKFVGRMVAKALLDGQVIDAYFTRSIYKHLLGLPLSYRDVEAIDPEYFKNLEWMLDNNIEGVLDLTFTAEQDEFGAARVVELIEGGSNTEVTEENKGEYVRLVAQHRMTGAIEPQLEALLEGFHELVPKDLIAIFNERELELLISGLPDIDLEDLYKHTEYHGYTASSAPVRWFWEVIRSLSKEELAKFLQFVTGTSKVPLEGFKALKGMQGVQLFQIHKTELKSPSMLPAAHTCYVQLDLPAYETREQLRDRLRYAIINGFEGFGFG